MHKIEQAIQVFLESIENKDYEDYDSLIEEFGENCKKAIRNCLFAKRKEETFKIRMSNIGRPLRQLMLEKLYGRGPQDYHFRLKMTYGYIWESFVLFLLKSSGLEVEEDKKVQLKIQYEPEKYQTVHGSLDIKIDGEIYDIKSASPWAYNNKFTTFANMESDDPFGYCGQAFGYSIADKSHFGGWIVCDKSDGRIKVVEVPKSKYRELALKYLTDFKHKISTILNPESEIPPCDGVIEETFNRQKTGNLVLNKNCEFCTHKYICHPNLVYHEDVNSNAKKKTWKYYVKLLKPSFDD